MMGMANWAGVILFCDFLLKFSIDQPSARIWIAAVADDSSVMNQLITSKSFLNDGGLNLE